jgi:hypothetical protein
VVIWNHFNIQFCNVEKDTSAAINSKSLLTIQAENMSATFLSPVAFVSQN